MVVVIFRTYPWRIMEELTQSSRCDACDQAVLWGDRDA